MSILHGATNVAISGGTYIAAAPGSTVTVSLGGGPGATSAFKDLSAAAAHTALPDSAARVHAPRCHRNTRTKFLNKFELWLLGAGDELGGKSVIWLNGGAGAGKSAIMQSIIDRCACHAVILGAFFFSRTDASRNFVDVLIPTLAYQLACAFPAAMAVLEPIILGNPLIFKASPCRQAYQLLVRPLLYLFDTGNIDADSALRRVFVLDGLDECSDPQKQALIIHIVASILCENHVPISFLIASRPEVAITSAFQREKELLAIFASITLHDDEDAQSDVRQFVEDGFLDILDSHPLRTYIQMPWPDAQSVDNLVRKSSGHFIYAATAIKFISSSDEHPRRALKVVEGIVPSRTASPFTELDALYTHILTRARYSKEVLTILKHVYLRRWSRSFEALCYIHDFSPEDVVLFLSDVQSLISLTPDPHTSEMTITPKHASLHDFLQSEQRSGTLHIEYYAYHTSLLKRYFQLVDNGPPTLASGYSLQCADLDELMTGLTEAIGRARWQDLDLLRSLIDQHSSYDIWNFCIKFYAHDEGLWSPSPRFWIFGPISHYLGAVCSAGVDRDRILHQVELYTQLVLDDLEDVARRKPQYRIIPAIMFSTNPSGLHWANKLLELWGHRFRVDAFDYQCFPFGTLLGYTWVYFKAIRCLAERRASWGSELALLMKLVLSWLVGTPRPPDICCTTPHKQWLRRHKPLKHLALGSPRLSLSFFANLFIWTYPDKCINESSWSSRLPAMAFSVPHMWAHWHGHRTFSRKRKCLTLLKAVVLYLRKSDRTIEVVKLAQRSLPMAAQWYPKLMKKARAEMDAYVRRWEDSQNGFLKITG